jgi:hypothetical protein
MNPAIRQALSRIKRLIPAIGTAPGTAAEGNHTHGSSTPYNAGNLTGTPALAYANGVKQFGALTGNCTFAVPTGGAAGAELDLWLTASGANRTINFHANILRPSGSAASWPYTVASGSSARVRLEYHGATWRLVSLVGNYSEGA